MLLGATSLRGRKTLHNRRNRAINYNESSEDRRNITTVRSRGKTASTYNSGLKKTIYGRTT